MIASKFTPPLRPTGPEGAPPWLRQTRLPPTPRRLQHRPPPGSPATAPAGDKPPVSAAKVAANRANAAKSTGPRTEAGRAASRVNAVKHGLRAEMVVLPGE